MYTDDENDDDDNDKDDNDDDDDYDDDDNEVDDEDDAYGNFVWQNGTILETVLWVHGRMEQFSKNGEAIVGWILCQQLWRMKRTVA